MPGISIAERTFIVSRLKRLDGQTYIGFGRYFLTVCTLQRRRIFVEPIVVERTLTHFQQAAGRKQFALLAYCWMPDHAHFLVEGFSSESDLRKFVNLAKQHSSYDYALNTGKALWQSGYYDRILRQSEDSRSVARYIVENPVRAGLVESPRDYPYLGSAVWTIDELLGSCW